MSLSEIAYKILPETPDDAEAIARLNARVFGPGRFVRTTYRLREMSRPNNDLSFIARIESALVGANTMTPILIGTTPAYLLGPLLVDPAFRRRGIGQALVLASLNKARDEGEKLVLLVGDEPYYRRMGFRQAPPRRFLMPGPVDPTRLLVCELQPGALNGVEGKIGGNVVMTSPMTKEDIPVF